MSFVSNTCPWPLAGLLVGLFAVTLQWIDNLPLGATGAAAGFFDWIRRPSDPPSWRALFFVGTVAGGALYGRVTHAALPAWTTPGLSGSVASRALLLTFAGGLIGFGARWAGGCTSGHGICGIGRLQRGSLVATLTFVLAAVGVANVVWRGAPL
jgi:uncharacterized membrane protein YedE/YeeE